MAALVLAVAVPTNVSAQAASPSGVVVQPGEQVRLRTAQWEYTGILARVANDTAVVLLGSDTVRVARPDALRTQVQRGTRSSTPRIMLASLAGAAVGTIVGGYLGVFAECGTNCSDNGEWSGIGGMLFGGASGLVAGGFGAGIWASRKKYPRWVRATLP